MTETSWTLDVGGVSVMLVGPTHWVGCLAEGWASWGGRGPAWEVRLVEDPGLPIPSVPFFAARPRFVEGRCLLEAPGFAGAILPLDARADLRAHPAAGLGDLSYFVRAVFALRAFALGAVLFHAAGIVHRGGAYALFGRSGSGKTTSAHLSPGKPVLNDDLVLLRPAGAGWEAWATPFGRRRVSEVRSAPLRALARLVQAGEDRLERMPTATALGELVAGSPVINADATRVSELLTRWEAVLQAVPVYSLYFRRSSGFWEVLDAHVD